MRFLLHSKAWKIINILSHNDVCVCPLAFISTRLCGVINVVRVSMKAVLQSIPTCDEYHS